MAENKLNFLSDFPEVTTQQWMDKITADLKGADFNKKLVWRAPEGFNVQPFYRKENLEGLQTPASAPAQFPYVRGTKDNARWAVRQDIAVSDAAQANAKALDVLNKGVNSIGFQLGHAELDASFVAALLKDIEPSAIELNFRVCVRKAPELLRLLTAYFTERGLDLSALEGSVECDPLDRMLRKGRKLTAAEVSGMVKAAVDAAAALPLYRVVGVSGLSLADAGMYSPQELGYALAWGNQYMEMLTEAGVPADEAARRIKFNMGVGGNYFMEIAKFRAGRMLWARIVEAYQPKCKCAAKARVHATTSLYNMTVFDAHVNLLRSQTEAMSAALGGVDSLTVRPFDVTYETPDEFSERIARNQQLLLLDESHFDKVIDPGAGSYYIENLTALVAQQAWQLFLAVQDEGGFFAAVEKGSVQAAVRDNAAKRLQAVASRKETLLGTNQFPNFSEVAGDKIRQPEACGGCCGHAPSDDAIAPLRGAEQFEALRLATERSGKRPKVFMLTIGNLAMRIARSQFSCNFFACAGYEVIDNLGFKSVEEGVAAARKAGADIITLCSSDDEYAEYAIPAFQAVGGKELFVVAGAPACMEDLQKAGIENFIHVRVNVLETLKAFNAKLGIN